MNTLRSGVLTSRASSTSALQERLEEALIEYHDAIDANRPIDRQALLEKYADVREELSGYLDSFELIRTIAPQLGGADQPARLPISEPATLGDYRIIREIGRGGMGVVYEAEQLSLGRRVALKVLPFAAMLDKQQLARFKNEARAAATLDHPNIVAIYSVGAERSVHYYAMQLIEGQSLADVIRQLRKTYNGIGSPPCGDAQPKNSVLSPPPCGEGLGEGVFSSNEDPTIEHQSSNIQHPVSSIQYLDTAPVAHLSTLPDFSSREYYRSVARLGIQAAEALDHAHQNGILHRDIKPANLMIDDDGKLWITDFGLARIEQDAGMTMTGDILGTLRYMSPEQALAKRVVVDHRSDIYSLGVTLYELLTLQPVYTAEDRQELLRQIAFDEPRPLRKLDKNIPAELETIVLKAIEKNPTGRYDTAQRLADDLRAFLENRPIKAKPTTVVGLAKKWSRRHKPLVTSMAASAAALLVITLGVLAYSNIAIKREQDKTSAALEEKANALHDRTTALASSERNYKKALEAIDGLLARMGNEKLAEVPQLDQLRMDVLTDTLGYYESFVAENPDDRKLQFELAKTYRRVGTMYHDFWRQYPAMVYRAKAIAILDGLHANDPPNAAYRYELAVALFQHGWFAGVSYFRRSIDLFEDLVQEFPENVAYREGLVDALRSYGDDLVGDAVCNDKVRSIVKRALEVAKSPGVYKRHLGHAYDLLAELAACEKRLDEAEADRWLAIEAYSEAIAERPTDGRTREHQMRSYKELAELMEQRGDADQAERWSRKAVEMGEELTHDFPSMRNFRVVENQIVTKLVALLKKQDRSDAATKLLSQLTPTSPQDFIDRATLYSLLGQAELADADYEQSVLRSRQEIDADHATPSTYEAMFAGLIRLGRRGEALDLLRNMPTPDVDWLAARVLLYDDNYYYLSSIVNDNKLYVELCSRLVGYCPTDLSVLGFRAAAYERAGQFDLALQDANKAIELEPDSEIARNNRGFIHYEMHNWELALADYNDAIRLGANNSIIFHNRGQTYTRLGRFDEALADCAEAIRIDPGDTREWTNRGDLRYAMKQYEMAVKDYSEAIRLAPNDSIYLVNRGSAYRDWQHYREAIADYQAASALDENFWRLRINLAWLLATADKDEFRDGKRALELAQSTYDAGDFGNYGEAKFLRVLAGAHAEVGNFDKAVECCRKAIQLASDDKELLEKLMKELANYEAGRPWRIGDDAK